MNIADYLKKDITQWPNWINYILLKINVFGKLVYGFSYIKMRKQIHKQDPEKLLIESVNHAIKNVKYYRDRYGDLRINSIDEFKSKIGFIDKDEVMNHWDDFLVDNIDLKKCNIGTTGGTSGKALKLVTPKNRYIIELAHIHQLWEKTGWNFNVRAVIRNHKLPNSKIYTINPITKEIIFDAFRTTDEYYKQIYDVIRKYNIHFIQSYPSSLFQFCKSCNKQELNLSIIKYVFCSSETITDEQYYFINKVIGIKIFNLYGHSEKLVMATNIKGVKGLVTEPTYGFTELIIKNEEGKENNIGEIVGSTYYNRFMPLIRYKTGDYAGYIYNENNYSIVFDRIYGRWDKSLIYKEDKTTTSATILNLHSDLYEYIDGIQYIQEKIGELIILIIKGDNYNEKIGNAFLNHFKSAMGENSKVEIRYVDKLIFQPNGKFLPLISKI